MRTRGLDTPAPQHAGKVRDPTREGTPRGMRQIVGQHPINLIKKGAVMVTRKSISRIFSVLLIGIFMPTLAAPAHAATDDTTPPSVVSITGVNPNPTTLANIDFTVTFSESVMNVDSSDFNLFITSGINDANITNLSGAGTSYTITVNTGMFTEASSDLLNINFATLIELDSLPGIGPTTAQKIIDYRVVNGPFSRIEDIMNVSGIGPATFNKLKNLITVDGLFLRLDVVDDDTIIDINNNKLGGPGLGNGNFTNGQYYTILAKIHLPLILR